MVRVLRPSGRRWTPVRRWLAAAASRRPPVRRRLAAAAPRRPPARRRLAAAAPRRPPVRRWLAAGGLLSLLAAAVAVAAPPSDDVGDARSGRPPDGAGEAAPQAPPTGPEVAHRSPPAAPAARRSARAPGGESPGPAPGVTPPASPGGPGLAPAPAAPATPDAYPGIRWRRSRAIGLPFAGRLRRGVQLPTEGADFVTWDPVLKRSPNRGWRRWGTDRLVRIVLAVLRDYRAAHPEAPRVAVGDLSRPQGGEFGPRFGGLGHVSHQNGLDVDVYYPRRDRIPRRPWRPDQVDRELAQDLVDRFVAAGARVVFVGPRLRLRGPRKIIQPLVHHDDHLHVRLRSQ
jgi:hypothetical protein